MSVTTTSGFFNSINGDRVYNADQISYYFEGLISSGVIANPSTSLQVTADGADMTVQVQPGRAFINSRWLKVAATGTLTLSAADGLLNRIDAVIMKYSVFDRVITIEVKEGTAATSPTAPVMSRNEAVVEYCLATVYIAAGATKITQANITDTRPNSSVCGFVTNLVNNIDVTALYAQWEAAFNAKYKEFNDLYEAIKETLQVPTRVKMYEATYAAAEGTTSFPINIAEYVTGDALLVHLEGIKLTAGTDYTVSGNNIVLSEAINSDRTYTVTVFKAEIS